jgi:hypothetical protein
LRRRSVRKKKKIKDSKKNLKNNKKRNRENHKKLNLKIWVFSRKNRKMAIQLKVLQGIIVMELQLLAHQLKVDFRDRRLKRRRKTRRRSDSLD